MVTADDSRKCSEETKLRLSLTRRSRKFDDIATVDTTVEESVDAVKEKRLGRRSGRGQNSAGRLFPPTRLTQMTKFLVLSHLRPWFDVPKVLWQTSMGPSEPRQGVLGGLPSCLSRTRTLPRAPCRSPATHRGLRNLKCDEERIGQFETESGRVSRNRFERPGTEDVFKSHQF